MPSVPAPSASSICERLHHFASLDAERPQLTYLRHGRAEPTLEWSRGQLRDQAAGVARELLRHDWPPGERVLLLFPAVPEFLAAFLGCQLARLIPVPASLPDFRADTDRLKHILRDCEPAAILALSADAERLRSAARGRPVLAVERCARRDGAALPWRDLDPAATAMLQYTSGSTSAPKGVMTTHENLVVNLDMQSSCLGTGEESVFVHWLPHFHDMGLIGCKLAAVFLGAREVCLPSTAFLRRPLRWLRAISDYRGTTTTAPNFAYDWCARLPDADPPLDLGSLTAVCNAAEAISPDTTRRFIERFQARGLNPRALRHLYGLAEATLFASGDSGAEPPRSLSVHRAKLAAGVAAPEPASEATIEVAGIGRAWDAGEMRVVDPDTRRPKSSGEVGELWIHGPHVANGYWNAPDATRETFQARIEGDPDTSWLRTGDLGFHHEGEFFFTGRLKEVIILRGRNHYPQDLERYVAGPLAEASNRPGIAFAAPGDSGSDFLVFAQEAGPKDDFGALAQKIRATLSESARVPVATVLLLKPGTITRTTSGKIERRACARRFAAGDLKDSTWARFDFRHKVATDAPMRPLSAEPTVEELQGWLAEWLGTDTIGPDESVLGFGLDSLGFVQLMTALDEALGREIPGSHWAPEPTPARLAFLLTEPPATKNAPLSNAWTAPEAPKISRWRRRLYLGPSIRGRHLSYPAGLRWLRRLSGWRRWRRHLYPKQESKIRECFASLEASPAEVEAAVSLSFLNNTWIPWRVRAFEKTGRRPAIDGELPADTGVIIAFPHAAARWILPRLPFLSEREFVVVGNHHPASLAQQGMSDFALAQMETHADEEPDPTAVRAATLRRSISVLRNRGIAIVLADDTAGAGGITHPFHGRWRPVRPGISALAEATACPVVPVSLESDLAGEIRLEIHDPLDPERLLENYAEHLARRWPRDIAQLEWRMLNQYLTWPPMNHE